MLYFRLGFRVIYDLMKENYKTEKVVITNIKFGVLKEFTSKDLFSFMYKNPEVQWFKLKTRLLNSNRLNNFNIYITVKEANDEFNLATENDMYEITYLYSSRAVISIRKLEKLKSIKYKAIEY